jgi:hypothetical protein
MGSWREQALIEAPVEEVWRLVGDPRRYPEWVGEEVIEVTGLPTVVEGAEYEQVTRGPLGTGRTKFEIETLDDLHEISLRCTASGWYSRWKLTEAGGNTFADVEIGMEPISAPYKAIDVVTGKRWYRRMAKASVDGIKRAVASRSVSSPN